MRWKNSTIRFSPPDFIFLDFNMPKMNGIECLKKIRKLSPDPNLCVIMYSTEINYILQKALEEGANGCLKKTATIQALSTVLKDFFVGEDRVSLNKKL